MRKQQGAGGCFHSFHAKQRIFRKGVDIHKTLPTRQTFGVQILKRNTPDSPVLTCPAYKFKISNLQYVLQKPLVIQSLHTMQKSMQSYRSGSFIFIFPF